MFERFTGSARQVVVLAQEEARRLNHNYIGTEHVLLGLLRVDEGLAAKALESLGISLAGARQQLEQIIGRGDEQPPGGHIPFTPRAKKALELSLREALQLKHNYIGTEHIMLGLLREGEGMAAQILVKLGADLTRARQQVIRLVAQGPSEEPAAAPRHRTPAMEQVVATAEELASGAPMGSHHILEALARSENSAAAKVLGALGLDADTLAAKIDEVGIEGTSDLTEQEAAARLMEIRLADGEPGEVQIVLRDEIARELVRVITGELGGPVRGDDPVSGLVGLHQAVVGFLAELRSRVAPPPEDPHETESGTGMSLIQRAIRSRLRRRRSS